MKRKVQYTSGLNNIIFYIFLLLFFAVYIYSRVFSFKNFEKCCKNPKKHTCSHMPILFQSLTYASVNYRWTTKTEKKIQHFEIVFVLMPKSRGNTIYNLDFFSIVTTRFICDIEKQLGLEAHKPFERTLTFCYNDYHDNKIHFTLCCE